jgi:outer membrane murein-binding lipoprotein Lpp
MSLKNTKNLLIVVAVVVAVLAGTVLLANYTNILSGGSDTASQPKACQATGNACCPAAKACSAENAKVESTLMAQQGPITKTCPLDPTKPCCAQDASKDCTKPCCSGEAKPDCCPKSDAAAATGCCPKIVTATE